MQNQNRLALGQSRDQQLQRLSHESSRAPLTSSKAQMERILAARGSLKKEIYCSGGLRGAISDSCDSLCTGSDVSGYLVVHR
jgi:hypothetical protein